MQIARLLIPAMMVTSLAGQSLKDHGLGTAVRMVEMERTRWETASSALGLGYQGYQGEGEEIRDWNYVATQIAMGGSCRDLTRAYLLQRWKQRHEAISVRYPGAIGEQEMVNMFPASGWTSYRQYAMAMRTIIQVIDGGELQ